VTPESNLQLHDRAVAAINAREVPEDLLAPGFRMENRASAVTDYTYYGARGWREWMSDLFEVFADGARYAADEILAVGDDYIAATFSLVGRGRGSGEPLEFRWAGVTWFRDGKAIRACGFTNAREALEAVGLGEPDASVQES
jgi:ketosteroid isomerase-like protein